MDGGEWLAIVRRFVGAMRIKKLVRDNDDEMIWWAVQQYVGGQRICCAGAEIRGTSVVAA